MIDREQVLHVARLARLDLREEEIEPMARELSAVLDHVATIGRLDLDGVAPTSHVVEVTGRLRADEPRPSWPRDVVLAQAPDASEDGFIVPSPQGGSVESRRLAGPLTRPSESSGPDSARRKA